MAEHTPGDRPLRPAALRGADPDTVQARLLSQPDQGARPPYAEALPLLPTLEEASDRRPTRRPGTASRASRSTSTRTRPPTWWPSPTRARSPGARSHVVRRGRIGARRRGDVRTGRPPHGFQPVAERELRSRWRPGHCPSGSAHSGRSPAPCLAAEDERRETSRSDTCLSRRSPRLTSRLHLRRLRRL